MTYIKLTIDGGDEVQVYQYTDGELSSRFDCPTCNGTDSADMDSTGVWACDDCPASGTCDHSSNHVETVTLDGLGMNGHTQRDVQIYVCNWCDSHNDGILPADDHQELRLQNEMMEVLQK